MLLLHNLTTLIHNLVSKGFYSLAKMKVINIDAVFLGALAFASDLNTEQNSLNIELESLDRSIMEKATAEGLDFDDLEEEMALILIYRMAPEASLEQCSRIIDWAQVKGKDKLVKG